MCRALPRARIPGPRQLPWLTAFAAILFSATPPASAADSNTVCRIRTIPGDGFLTIQAVARSDAPLQGRYLLLLDKNSETGRSRNVQSGQFALPPGQEEILSTVTLDESAKGHMAAELTLDWSQGRTSCHSP